MFVYEMVYIYTYEKEHIFIHILHFVHKRFIYILSKANTIHNDENKNKIMRERGDNNYRIRLQNRQSRTA